jgi:hypothetical protein
MATTHELQAFDARCVMVAHLIASHYSSALEIQASRKGIDPTVIEHAWDLADKIVAVGAARYVEPEPAPEATAPVPVGGTVDQRPAAPTDDAEPVVVTEDAELEPHDLPPSPPAPEA